MGIGLTRSIRLRISANKSRSIANSIGLNVWCGSNPVLADLAQRRRLSQVKRTSRPRKQTLPT